MYILKKLVCLLLFFAVTISASATETQKGEWPACKTLSDFHELMMAYANKDMAAEDYLFDTKKVCMILRPGQKASILDTPETRIIKIRLYGDKNFPTVEMWTYYAAVR